MVHTRVVYKRKTEKPIEMIFKQNFEKTKRFNFFLQIFDQIVQIIGF